MAGYTPPNYGGPYPPPYQEHPPLQQHFYNPPANYAGYQNLPQSSPVQQDLNVLPQNAPTLDPNQLAYFWNQVQAGNIPSITPTGPSPHNSMFGAPVPPSISNPLAPMANPFAAMVQQSPQTPSMHTSTQASWGTRQPQLADVASKPERENGEVSETDVTHGGWTRPKDGTDLRKQSHLSKKGANGRRNGSQVTSQPASTATSSNTKSQQQTKRQPQQQQRIPRSNATPSNGIDSSRMSMSAASNAATENIPIQPSPSKPPTPSQYYEASDQARMNGIEPTEPTRQTRPLREAAQTAVLKLRESGIGYASLAQEPAFNEQDKKLLKQLFEESGIPIHTSDDTTMSGSQNKQLAPSSKFQQASKQATTPATGLQSEAKKPLLSKPSRPVPGLGHTTTAVGAIPGLNGNASASQQISVSSAQITTTETSAALPKTQQTEEVSPEEKRRLFLQRLNAARSKKSAVSPNSLQASQASEAAGITTPISASHAVEIATQPQLAAPPILGTSKKDVPTPVRLNNAELNRRMESLRQQAALNAKLRPVVPSRSTSMSSIDYTQSRDSEASESVDEALQSSRMDAPPSKEIVAHTVDQPQTRPSIPGLSMSGTDSSLRPDARLLASPYSAPTPASHQAVPQAPSPNPSRLPQLQAPGSQYAPPKFTAARPQSPFPAPNGQPQANPLKRAVPASTGPIQFGSFKHQFGYNRHANTYQNNHQSRDKVVIDVSSDEDDGSDMSIDGEERGQNLRTPQANRVNVNTQTLYASNLPARPNFSGRPFQPGHSSPSSAMPTPPIVSVPGPLEIQRRHEELEEQKNKLQEQLNRRLEESKKLKAEASGSATPKPAVTTAIAIGLPKAAAIDSSQSFQISTPLEASTLATPKAPVVSSPSVNSPKPESVESIRRRAHLRSIESSVATKNTRMEELKKQMQELEDEIRRGQAELASELEMLGVDTDGMTHQDMQAAKDDLAQAADEVTQQGGVLLVDAPTDPLLIERDPSKEAQEAHMDDEEGEIVEDAEPLVTEVIGAADRGSLKPDMPIPAQDPTEVLDIVNDAPAEFDDEETSGDASADEIDQGLNMVPSDSSESDSDSDNSDDDDDNDDDEEEEEGEHGELKPGHSAAWQDLDMMDTSVYEEQDSSAATTTASEIEELQPIESASFTADADSASEVDESSREDNEEPVTHTPVIGSLTQVELEQALASGEDGGDSDMADLYGSTPEASTLPTAPDLAPPLASNAPRDSSLGALDDTSSESSDEDEAYEPPAATTQSPIQPTATVSSASAGEPADGQTKATTSERNESADLEDGELYDSDETPHTVHKMVSHPEETSSVPEPEQLPLDTDIEEGAASDEQENDSLFEDDIAEKHNSYASPENDLESIDPDQTVVPLMRADIPIKESHTATNSDADASSEQSFDNESPRSGSLSNAVADEIAPELQVPELQPPKPVNAANGTASSVPSHLTPFTPYESPLKYFKAYRNHPNFPEDVVGGVKSLTYSHMIHPDQPLCQFEMTGGTCNDPLCSGQHFRSMQLPDSHILVQLGTLKEGRSEEEKERWSIGLNNIIAELRAQKVTDTALIAARIANYRRKFFGDPSRVLDL